MLGRLQLSDGQQHHERLPSRAVTALLLRLALAPERLHAREELVDLLWPGVDLAVGRNRLRQALSVLKSLLEPPGAPPAIVADRLGVRLVPGALDCDARAFDADCRAGRFDAALLRYRGELLPGFYDEWIADERLRLAALAERAQSRAPLPASVPQAVPATRTSMPGRSTLPAYLTRFFGGDERTAPLVARVQQARLVTLTGPGGSGKTRLAVEAAHALEAQAGFDLVAFVPLASCSAAAELPGRLLAALRPGATGGGHDDVVQALAGRRALLVLDNLEQMLPAAAAEVAALAVALPGLHLLATSRRRLELDGEHEWSVGPLALPAADAAAEEAAASPALALFVDRARAARADFHLGVRNAGALVALVRALEGMPLAIELAASRVRSFSPAEMLERLRGHGPGATPGLDLLARRGPRAGTDGRHASMHRVIAWSWEQLAPPEAALMGALSLFDGGFTAAAAEAVSGDADAHLRLDGLLAHSLLHAREQRDGSLRFALYEPIREFAAATPADDTRRALRQRLRAWWLAWACALPPTPPLAALRAELPNLTAAATSALADGVPDDALALALALGRTLADAGTPTPLLQALDQALAASRDAALRCPVHALCAQLAFEAGARDAALAHVERSLALAPASGPMRARALHTAASVRWRGRHGLDGIAPLIAEGHAHAGSDRDVRASLFALEAYIANQAEHDYARGKALHRQAFALWQAGGNRLAIDAGRYNLAMCAYHAGRLPEALAELQAVVASTRETDDTRQESRAHNLLGLVLAAQRDWADALDACRACVRGAWATAGSHLLAYGLWNAPRLLAHLRRPADAARLMAFAAEHWRTHFAPLTAEDQRDLRRLRRLVQRQLPLAAIEAAEAEGRRLAPADAVALLLGA